MQADSTPPDIVTVMIAAASWLVGPEAAAIIGPYSVIFLTALGGATWAATRRRVNGVWRTSLDILLSVGLALIATVPVAELLANWTGVNGRWVLAAAAAVIAARPQWVVEIVRQRFMTMAKHDHKP